MISDTEMATWLAHRVGDQRSDFIGMKVIRKAYELNKDSHKFVETFGNRDIKGFIGFIDLVGFSERSKGQTPNEIEAYLTPFMKQIIEILYDNHCIIDKTIGDEIMFCMPERAMEIDLPSWIEMGRLLGCIYASTMNLGSEYPFRISLAYGSLRIAKLGATGYSEYTTFGETVHLAKRLQKIKEAEDILQSNCIAGSFGILKQEEHSTKMFELILEYIAGIASKMTYQVIETSQPLKGISPYLCAVLFPKSKQPR